MKEKSYLCRKKNDHISMNILRTIKRPFIWLTRIRYRKGYGVHSPFAFELIAGLMEEKIAYYAYEPLKEEQKRLFAQHTKADCAKGWNHERRKVNQLLFRLVNRYQPHTIIDAGALSAASIYLQAGKASAHYTFASDLTMLFLEADASVDFLYLHQPSNPKFVAEVYDICAHRTTPQSLFVIGDIYASASMRTRWKALQNDPRVGITFDLYDIGILFFDKKKIKQHYRVNF